MSPAKRTVPPATGQPAHPEELPGNEQDIDGKRPSDGGESAGRTFVGQAPELADQLGLVDRVVDRMDPAGNILIGTSLEQAEKAVREGDVEAVRKIRGQFAIVQIQGKTIRMARSIARPMRYFLSKRAEGPALIVAERIDEIAETLAAEGLEDQFDPQDTRMVPAHYLLELQLVGAPNPCPRLTRYFAPVRNRLPADISEIGKQYIGKLLEVCDAYLETIDPEASIGVLFSGGIDSGSVLLVMDFLIRRRGQSPSRLKAFTMSVDGGGSDLDQARSFLKQTDREMYLEVIDVPRSEISWKDAVATIEDYKPLDVQSATMALAMLKTLRQRYPDWEHLLDGDGGDENLKDYPIEDNPGLTVRSVLGNRMLYQEGWGVDAVKHSLTYSGGQSRGHVRTSATAGVLSFRGFSPYAVPDVIEVAEAIPFVQLTDWNHERLYALKGEIVAAGVEAITGIKMPIFEKNRFQRGAVDPAAFETLFPQDDREYRNTLAKLFA